MFIATFFINEFMKTLITNKHQEFIQSIRLVDHFFQVVAKTASFERNV